MNQTLTQNQTTTSIRRDVADVAPWAEIWQDTDEDRESDPGECTGNLLALHSVYHSAGSCFSGRWLVEFALAHPRSQVMQRADYMVRRCCIRLRNSARVRASSRNRPR